MFANLVFRQLFDAASSTYTYLLGDPDTRQAVVIDTVFEQHLRDRALIDELGLKLVAVVDTHCHADHVTGAWLMQQATGCRIGISRRYQPARRRASTCRWITVITSRSAPVTWRCAPRPATPMAVSRWWWTTAAWHSPATRC